MQANWGDLLNSRGIQSNMEKVKASSILTSSVQISSVGVFSKCGREISDSDPLSLRPPMLFAARRRVYVMLNRSG